MEIVNLLPEGFNTYGNITFGYVTNDGKTLYQDVPDQKIMITSETDLQNLPAEIPPGTEAYLADGSAKWRKAADGSWPQYFRSET